MPSHKDIEHLYIVTVFIWQDTVPYIHRDIGLCVKPTIKIDHIRRVNNSRSYFSLASSSSPSDISPSSPSAHPQPSSWTSYLYSVASESESDSEILLVESDVSDFELVDLVWCERSVMEIWSRSDVGLYWTNLQPELIASSDLNVPLQSSFHCNRLHLPDPCVLLSYSETLAVVWSIFFHILDGTCNAFYSIALGAW